MKTIAIFQRLSAVAALAAVLTFPACKPGNAPEEPKYEYDVYVAGEEGKFGETSAVLWKNGEAIVLADKSKKSYAQSVFVDKENVYIAGWEGERATLWGDGVATKLSDGPNSGSFFANISVYVVRREAGKK